MPRSLGAGICEKVNKHLDWHLENVSFLNRYFAEHDKATALQMLNDSLQPKHK